MESFTEGVTYHADGEAALRYAQAVMMILCEGDTVRQKRQQYVIQKLAENSCDSRFYNEYRRNSQNIRKSCLQNERLYSRKLFQIAPNGRKEALLHFESDTISGDGR